MIKKNRSLKLYFFVSVLFAALLVLFANRLLSQFLMHQSIESEQRDKIEFRLRECINQRYQEIDLRSCILTNSRGLFESFFAHSYILCGTGVFQTKNVENALCALPFVTDSKYPARDHVSSGTLTHEGQKWIFAVFKQDADRLAIALPSSRVAEGVTHMWSIRDRLLVYAALPLLLSVIALAIFITYQSTRLVHLLGLAIAESHFDHIAAPSRVQSPFKEFDGFVDLYKKQQQTIQDHIKKAHRFVSHASHELRTPLTILRGNADSLLGELPSGSPEQQKLAVMSEEIEELIDIIDKLLVLQKADAKILATHMRTIDFSALMTDYLNDVESFNSSIVIEKNIHPLLFLNCEPQLIKQLISNLLSNALKFNLSKGWVNIGLRKQSNEICLEISNPTLGRHSDFTNEIFERFYRGPNSRVLRAQGHGLGLSICLEIANAHRATLAITFQDGVVTLTCRFPAAPPP